MAKKLPKHEGDISDIAESLVNIDETLDGIAESLESISETLYSLLCGFRESGLANSNLSVTIDTDDSPIKVEHTN